MSETAEHGRFTCDGCGKSYRWKPELAGKKAKCKCGSTMTVPAEDPAAGDDLNADLYALAEDANAKKHQPASTSMRCPSCGGEMMPGTMLCVSCGYNMRSGRKLGAKVVPAMAGGGGGGTAVAAVTSPMLGYAGVAKKTLGKDEVGENNLFEYYLPAGLAVFGIIFQFLELTAFSSIPLPLKFALPTVAVSVFVNLVLLTIGCLAAVKMMDITLGAPGPAALKLAAIGLAPGAISDLVVRIAPGSGMFLGWAVAIILYYTLFHYLFDLDLGEILLLSCIIFVVRMFLAMFLTMALLALIMGGSGGPIASLANGVASGAANSSSSSAAVSSDSDIAEQIANTKHAAEAQAWLTESAGRIFGKEPHDECLAITKSLYDAGASKVTAIKDGSQASEVIVTLPKNKDARKKIFEWHKKNLKKYEWEEIEDGGQKYLSLDFDTVGN